jgi:hypothetical protein
LRLRGRGSGCLTLGLLRVLSIPAPDGPVVGSAVFLALEVEAGDRLKDFQPVAGITTDLDLRAGRSKRVEGLVEQVAHHASLRLVASGTDVADGQVVVDTHVAFDETRQLPVMCRSVIALQDKNVATRRGTPIALAAALVVGMSQRTPDRLPQRSGVVDLGSSDAISQTTFFHGASCGTA